MSAAAMPSTTGKNQQPVGRAFDARLVLERPRGQLDDAPGNGVLRDALGLDGQRA